jgi:hypothetical protein
MRRKMLSLAKKKINNEKTSHSESKDLEYVIILATCYERQVIMFLSAKLPLLSVLSLFFVSYL